MRVYAAADVQKALALTIHQPHAHRISLGLKPVENRDHGNYCFYRGVLLIHAGKSLNWLDDGDMATYPGMPFGAIESIATVTAGGPIASLPTALQEHEHTYGPFCLVMEDVYRLAKPVAIGGAQGLWRPPAPVLAAVIEQLEVRP